MAAHDEDQQIAALVRRLAAQFPAINTDTVEGIVAEIHHGFDGRPVRDFIPLLVERRAVRRLRQPADTSRR
ncbi:three-helix bundle dimerization domain-containing protein [Nocardia sp. NPDC059239]|uniref:three-helix bundle dimerization domain-containing protein n=1 Tax=unclassified Nocardia TaxID=2637762 RepID=UPI00368AD6DA